MTRKTDSGTGAGPSHPLENQRWEKFCQLYAGKHWGHATKAYLEVYDTQNPAAARTSASRLLTNDVIYSRVEFLREEARRRIAMDRLALLERRVAWMDDPDTQMRDRAAIARDIEKSLGLDAPEKIELTGQADVACRFPLLERLMADPAGFAAAVHALRLKREKAREDAAGEDEGDE